jgi:hypothetical protein
MSVIGESGKIHAGRDIVQAHWDRALSGAMLAAFRGNPEWFRQEVEDEISACASRHVGGGAQSWGVGEWGNCSNNGPPLRTVETNTINDLAPAPADWADFAYRR